MNRSLEVAAVEVVAVAEGVEAGPVVAGVDPVVAAAPAAGAEALALAAEPHDLLRRRAVDRHHFLVAGGDPLNDRAAARIDRALVRIDRALARIDRALARIDRALARIGPAPARIGRARAAHVRARVPPRATGPAPAISPEGDDLRPDS